MAEGRYARTIKICLRLDRMDDNSWYQVYDSVNRLRTDIICTVCKKLALKPVRPLTSECHHAVCRNCVDFRLMQGNVCAQCGDYHHVEDHTRLRLLCHGYKRMCELLLTSQYIQGWRHRTDLTEPMKQFLKVIHEGARYEDISPLRERYVDALTMPSTSLNDSTTNHSSSEQDEINTEDTDVKPVVEPESPMESTRTMTQNANNLMTLLNALGDISDDELVDAAIEKIVPNLPKRCRCGLRVRANQRRNCSTELCPCYVKGKGCTLCCCRNCKNPVKDVMDPPAQPTILEKMPRMDADDGKAPSKKVHYIPIPRTLGLSQRPRKHQNNLAPGKATQKKAINLMPVRSSLVLGEGPQTDAVGWNPADSNYSADDSSSDDDYILPDFSSGVLGLPIVSMDDFEEISDTEIQLVYN